MFHVSVQIEKSTPYGQSRLDTCNEHSATSQRNILTIVHSVDGKSAHLLSVLTFYKQTILDCLLKHLRLIKWNFVLMAMAEVLFSETSQRVGLEILTDTLLFHN